jgi:hypothetical protein
LQDHPLASNPKAPLFISQSDQNYGKPIKRDGLWRQFHDHYKERYFPQLLERDDVSSYDKEIIAGMLKKPWNLYVFRHTSITDKSKIISENLLRLHAGWTLTSKMPQKYLHYFGSDSSSSLLEAYGVIKDRQKNIDMLRPQPCFGCNEPNKPDAKFCVKCKMILKREAYDEIIKNQELQKQQEKDRERNYQSKLDQLEEKLEKQISDQNKHLLEMIQLIEDESLDDIANRKILLKLIKTGQFYQPTRSVKYDTPLTISDGDKSVRVRIRKDRNSELL